LSGYKYRTKHIKGTKNLVADTLSRIELPIDSQENTENFDDKVANINNISDVALDDDMTLDNDLHDRSDHVWVICLNRPTSDNYDDNDDKLFDVETKTNDDLDNMLSPYDVQQLQDSCPD